MLLCLALPTDSNGLYIIKEVEDNPERSLVGWKFVTLSDIISCAQWNLQAGGERDRGVDKHKPSYCPLQPSRIVFLGESTNSAAPTILIAPVRRASAP
jgi:hypothetical protein